ncbi:MAG: recombinase family protein [Bacilli bacterium]|nr:recombinase family protein [Bacilli bacterium]
MEVINKMISDNELDLICIFQSFNTTNANGRIVQRIITSVAQNEIERTSERTKIGMNEKHKTLEKNRMQNFIIFLKDYFPLQI